MNHQHPILIFELIGVALALSKALQILLPLAFFVLIRNVSPIHRLFVWMAERKVPGASPELRAEIVGIYERRLGHVTGFVSWKIGCDLGFFLIMPNSLWQAATLAGLIPYTLVQYLIYRLLGQKMVLSGMKNPLAEERYQLPRLERKKMWRRLISRWLHEDLNATSPHVPTRRVLLKPFIDFGALVLSWSFYTIGLFWFDSGEWNLAPLTTFPIPAMLGMYVGGAFAFIVGFNLGSIIFGLVSTGWGRGYWRQAAWAPHGPRSRTWWTRWRRSLRWRFQPFLVRSRLTLAWIFSACTGILVVGVLAKPMASEVRTAASQVETDWNKPAPAELEAQRRLTEAGLDPAASTPDFIPLLRHYLKTEFPGKNEP